MSLATVSDTTSAVTMLVGAYVAYLAYRGYRRNDSPTMGALAVGIAFIAVVPYVLTLVVVPALALSDALAILGVTLSHTVGLLAIYRSFD